MSRFHFKLAETSTDELCYSQYNRRLETSGPDFLMQLADIMEYLTFEPVYKDWHWTIVQVKDSADFDAYVHTEYYDNRKLPEELRHLVLRFSYDRLFVRQLNEKLKSMEVDNANTTYDQKLALSTQIILRYDEAAFEKIKADNAPQKLRSCEFCEEAYDESKASCARACDECWEMRVEDPYDCDCDGCHQPTTSGSFSNCTKQG